MFQHPLGLEQETQWSWTGARGGGGDGALLLPVLPRLVLRASGRETPS